MLMRTVAALMLVLLPHLAFADADSDGFDAPADCNDNDASLHPGAPELCDGIDNDCNALFDDNIPVSVWFPDADHDGYGQLSAAGAVTGSCPPDDDYTSWSPFNTDCKDTDATIHPPITTEDWTHPPLANLPPESSEADRDPSFVGDGIDEDCDGVDLCYVDADDDKFGAPGVGGALPAVVADNNLSCRDRSLAYTADNALDCDDDAGAVGPGAPEIAGDGIDQDCDGVDAVATADTDAPGDTDVFTMAGQDTDGGDDTDSGTAKPAGCGCDSSTGSPLWLGLGLAWLARRRRAAV